MGAGRSRSTGDGHDRANAQAALGLAALRQEDRAEAGSLLVITTYNLAQGLLELDPGEHRDEADRLLLRVIEAQPYGELAAKAKVAAVGQRDL